jgi:hypothetical protein
MNTATQPTVEAGCGRKRALPGTHGAPVPWFARVRVRNRRYLYLYDCGPYNPPQHRIGAPVPGRKRFTGFDGVAAGIGYDDAPNSAEYIVRHHLRHFAWRRDGDEGLVTEAVKTLLAVAELMGLE